MRSWRNEKVSRTSVDAGEREGIDRGMAGEAEEGEDRETGDEGDAYDPVTKRVTKWKRN
jgi:hypothetical protein